ncbi:hypothetical protein [Bacillus sp. FSL M8-0168]|uniref:hypothetical protein n=1 Tax=Bacillus sp. FSL M8-0168 TaxID=2921614 RepID=UPI0030FDB2EF
MNGSESKKVSLRSSTIVNHREQLGYNILPYLGTFKIKDITEEVLQHYINRLHNERKLAPATIRTAFRPVHHRMGRIFCPKLRINYRRNKSLE